jgi:hypothetical protein
MASAVAMMLLLLGAPVVASTSPAYAYRGSALKGSELHCVGSSAHVVAYAVSDVEEDTSISVVPAPERGAECRRELGAAGGVGHSRHFCVGANQDETCAAARNASLPLPGGISCQGCYVGAETDLYYALNVTRLRVENIGIGLRSTLLHSTLRLVADEGKPIGDKNGSLSLLQRPFEWALKVAGRVLFDLKISMPTELYYDFKGKEAGHADAGAQLLIDMGTNEVQYTRGKGWEHRRDKAKITLKPMVEGDYNAGAHLTMGLRSTLQVEIKNLLWFHVNVAPEVPLVLTSVGTSQGDLIHTCGVAGLNLDASHEADVHVKLHNHSFEKHWGPKVDANYHNESAVSKCVDIHPPKPSVVLV